MTPSPLSQVVQAAGTVCWTLDDGKLKVLLVHRPKYDDWSWPKGKTERGESLAETALREVEEETGLRIRLGVPLPSAEYQLPDGSLKHVSYWAAKISRPKLPPPPRPAEVDATRWVSARQARELLTRDDDAQQLDRVVELHKMGNLDTWPLIILRHGYAYPRMPWKGKDGDRPLVEAGEIQADHLRSLLASWDPTRVVSSPAKRCVDTVKGFASTWGKSVKLKKRFLEKRHEANPVKVVASFDKAIARAEPVVFCMHRPVLPTIMVWLAKHSLSSSRKEIPTSDPYLEPGEFLVADISFRTGTAVSAKRYRASTVSSICD